MTIVSRMLDRSVLANGSGPGRPFATLHTGWSLRRVATAIWDTALNGIAPLGYEDETGFHYGQPPHSPKLTGRPQAR